MQTHSNISNRNCKYANSIGGRFIYANYISIISRISGGDYISKEKRVEIALDDGTQITIPYTTIPELIEKLGRFKAIEEEITTGPTEEGNLKYIENEEVRDLCTDCLEQLRKMGIKIRTIKHYWFSVWYGKKRFMYLGCKQQFFVCEIQRTDGSWTDRLRVSTKVDWDKVFSEEIVPVFKNLGGTV